MKDKTTQWAWVVVLGVLLESCATAPSPGEVAIEDRSTPAPAVAIPSPLEPEPEQAGVAATQLGSSAVAIPQETATLRPEPLRKPTPPEPRPIDTLSGPLEPIAVPKPEQPASVPVQADPDLATETLKSSAATPAAVALLDAASAEQKSGNLSSAASNLERAQRIEPRNALVWYRLAVVRFRQGDLQQAEQLALKSDSLASSDSGLRARSWRLVALARERRGDAAGAAAAKRRVESLEP